MTDRFNTIAGWVLFSGIVALSLNAVSERVYKANKPERPEHLGYTIEGVVETGGDTGPDLGTLLAAADPAAGEKVFAKCSSCHTATQGGANGIGPNLYATVGEAVATGKAGFAFSDALKAKGGKWDFDSLNAWLTSPRKYAPGTKMTFAGLSNPKDRADVILYLNQQGSNLPLPAAPAAAPAGKEAKAADGNSAAPATGNASAPADGNTAAPAAGNAAAPAAKK